MLRGVFVNVTIEFLGFTFNIETMKEIKKHCLGYTSSNLTMKRCYKFKNVYNK